ncbi:TPA: DotI/IcmL family type IV secretion protein [Salmonella enterica subsp. salamae serovar 35:g,m,s,t:-]|nr:DotI/IcmL family type IV secretion protein [Salmonella enterica subsp. salamae serovar 35:g,m,s,t:-]HCA3549724.1 DotI/IcmL family type IV secretion protein [Salmonella enterica subsp. salamae serovar 35:g,m,s,t:-]
MTEITVSEHPQKALSLHKTVDEIDPVKRTIQDSNQQREIARKSLNVGLIQGYIIAVSVTANLFMGYALVHQPRTYFSFDHGHLTLMHSLDRPYYSTADVIQFGGETLINTFSLDFVNWRHQLEQVRPNFDTKGFASVIKQLQSSGMLDLVRKNRMDMTATHGTGVLTKQGLENGAFTWVIEMPLTIKLAGQTSQLNDQKFIATLHIHQVSTEIKPEGVEVTLVVTRPARGAV